MTEFLPEGRNIDTYDNLKYFKNEQTLLEAMKEEKILEGRAVVCDHEHNLVVDLGYTKGIIKKEEGAIGIKEGRVRDIAVISRVNRPVCFIITGFVTDTVSGKRIPLLSRAKAQKRCMEQYVSKLSLGDVIDAKITHLETFGAFADIGCGIVALMPIDCISVSRIVHPRERFTVGMDIKAIIKSKEQGRISLSHKELLGTWLDNAQMFSPGETVAGIVRSVESYGSFIELSPNLAGLAETRENIKIGEQASVYIKSILPEKMKIKLIVIDTFLYEYNPKKPHYFYKENHMDKFLYSPVNCTKVIETAFAPQEED